MALLNYILGEKIEPKTKLVSDNNKRVELWQELIRSYSAKESLARKFNHKTVDTLLADTNELVAVLNDIKALISNELITISHETKSDEDILEDINNLKPRGIIEDLSLEIVKSKQKIEGLNSLLNEILNYLKTELHIIELILLDPAHSKELLLKLFSIIYHSEESLYEIFNEENFTDKSKPEYDEITRILNAFLLEMNIEEKILSKEDIFEQEVLREMQIEDSEHVFRKLAEDIFYELTLKVGGIDRAAEVDLAMEDLEKQVENDSVMKKIVVKLVSKDYSQTQINIIIKCFREVYNDGFFEDLSIMFT